LTAANTWQTFSVNLGTIAGASPIGATWQLAFQLNSWQWNGRTVKKRVRLEH
jgi:hypothetical protein